MTVLWADSMIDFQLEQSVDLKTWNAVTKAPARTNGQWSVSIPTTQSSAFVRLTRTNCFTTD
jgi:hypothetical protein